MNRLKFGFLKNLGPAAAAAALLAAGGCATPSGLSGDAFALKMQPGAATYVAVPPDQVVFFENRRTIPEGMRSVPIAELSAGGRAHYASFHAFVVEMRRRAAALGGNAIVLKSAELERSKDGSFYKGHGLVYRLFQKDPSEDVDVKSLPGAMDFPPPPQ